VLGEQLDCRPDRQRRHRELVLTGHMQRSPRGGHHGHMPRVCQQLSHHYVGVGDLLQVVEHQQDPSMGDVCEEPRRDLAVGWYIEHPRQARPHPCSAAHAGHRRHEHPIGECIGHRGRQRIAQRGLARPTWTGQRHQPRPLGHQRVQLDPLLLPTYHLHEPNDRSGGNVGARPGPRTCSTRVLVGMSFS